MRHTITWLGLAALCAPGFSQDEVARPVPDKEAKVLVANFRTQLKDKKASLKTRLEAVQHLGLHHNYLLVSPLLSIARTDKAKTVRQEAVKALGKQPAKRARPALINLLKKADILEDPGMIAALVRAIGNSCYISKDWSEFEKLFERSLTEPKAVDAQRAILEVAGKQKEIDAVKFLILHIDEPAPAWVDDPSNPPQSYWEARYKNWQKWQSQVVQSLQKITGQEFGTAKEARTWFKKNGKKLRQEAKKAKKAGKTK